MRTRRASSRARVAIATFAAALVLIAASCGRDREACAVCGRAECRNMTLSIRLEGGRTVRACCPRCGLHYIETGHPQVASITVRDFTTARPIDAAAAVYVDGSDVSPCTAMSGTPPMDDHGCCLKPVFDRCTPSLIAFASREEARRFADEHGGMIRSFAEVRAQPRASLRSPG